LCYRQSFYTKIESCFFKPQSKRLKFTVSTFYSTYRNNLFVPATNDRRNEGYLQIIGITKSSLSNKSLVSIVTIAFNSERYIEQTIKSVANQSYDNIEYILIDGGSIDSTIDIFKSYDKHIDFWISEKDNGISDALNKGIAFSTGELIGIINSDDFYEDNSIHNAVKAYNSITRGTAVVIFGRTFKINHTNTKTIKRNFTKFWCMSIPFSHCSSFISKSYYDHFGLYDCNYKIAMDVDSFFSGKSKALFLEIPFFIANQRDGGCSEKQRLKGIFEYFKTSSNHYSLLYRLFCLTVKIIIATKNNFVDIFLLPFC
jgi:glycosyltransferase involved in cell wall biosynthesis